MLLPGEAIVVRDSKLLAKLGDAASELVDDLEDRYRPLFRDIQIWHQNYEALPLQTVKNFPFANASTVIVPLARTMVDAAVARLYTGMFSAGHRVWEARTENEDNMSLARNMKRYVNWQADNNDFNFRVPSYDWLLELCIAGSSVLAGNWRTEERYTFIRQGSGKDRRIVAVPVPLARGPIIEHTPREGILWDTAFPVRFAPAVVRELSLSWSEICRRAEQDIRESERLGLAPTWIEDQVKAIKGQGGRDHAPSEQVRRAKRDHDSQKRTEERSGAPYDIREIHADWPVMLELGFDERQLDIETAPHMPIVITLHRKSRRVVRLNAAPYFHPGKPFFDGYYRKRSGRGHSVGIVKRLEQLQLAATTIFNQQIDAQTRANSVFAKTGDRRHLEQPIDPSRPIYDPSNTFTPLALPGSQFSNIQLLQVIQAMSERDIGQSDPAFGRETRLGGHSAPATTTLALLSQADTLLGPTRDLVRQSISAVGEFIATLDQQFETDEEGKINRVLGEHDGEVVKQFLFPTEAIPGNYQFNVRGLSQDLNPDTQMNRAVVVSNMNQNYWAFVLRATQAMTQLNAAPLPQQIKLLNLQAWAKSIQSQTEAHERFLEAADIDDIQKFTLALQQGEQQRTAGIRDFAERAGELAGNQGAPPGAGVGGPQAALLGGAPGTNGGTPPPGLA